MLKGFKKDFMWSLVIFLVALIIDQVSKQIAIKMGLGHVNKGFIFGIGQDVSSTLRVITLSSVFGFIFFIYLTFIYILPNSLAKLKLYLGLFVGGISGNVLDRTLMGESIDFIPINIGDWHGPIFNLADVFQWVGALFIAYKLFKKDKIIWFPENQRGKYLINPKEQLIFSFKMMAASLSCSLLLGLFSMTFLQTLISESHSGQTLFNFAIGFLCLTLLFNLLVFYVGLHLSHRSAGPLYAFELYVEELLAGKRRELILRDGDNYKHLEKIANDLRRHFEKEDS